MKLTNDAAQIFGAFLQQADLTHEQETRLVARGDQEISKKVMEEILRQTPDNFDAAQALIRRSKCDRNPAFLTSFNGDLKSIREHVHVQRHQRVVRTRAYDPQEIPLELDPRGRFFVCASTTKFEEDVARPRPVLLKIVARTTARDGEPTDADKAALKEFLESCKVQKNFWNMRGDGEIVDQDILWVGAQRASIVVHEKDEREIGLGNGVTAITYDKAMAEISRVGKIDPINIERTQTYMEAAYGSNRPNFNQPIGNPVDQPGQDTTPPQMFNRNLQVSVTAKNLPRGAWIDDEGLMDKVSVGLRLSSRWLMEAGASGEVSLFGTTVKTKVAPDDWYYNGSAPAAAKVDAAAEHVSTIGQLFNESVETRRGRVSNEDVQFQRPEAQMTTEAVSLWSLVFENVRGITAAGVMLAPMQEVPPYQRDVPNPTLDVVKRPAPGCANGNDQVVSLKLKDFVKAADEGATTKGWTIDVGIRSTDAAGNLVWIPAKHAKGGDDLISVGAKGSGEQSLKIAIPKYEDAARAGHPIEIIVRNESGVPMTRQRIPLDQIDWAKDVA